MSTIQLSFNKEIDWAKVDTIGLKLFQIGAIIRISVRGVLLQMSSAYPGSTPARAPLRVLRP